MLNSEGMCRGKAVSNTMSTKLDFFFSAKRRKDGGEEEEALGSTGDHSGCKGTKSLGAERQTVLVLHFHSLGHGKS